MLLSNIGDEHRGLSPVSEAGFRHQLVLVPPTDNAREANAREASAREANAREANAREANAREAKGTRILFCGRGSNSF